MEPERQSLDLHRLPNQTNTIRIRTANRWAYIHILTHKKKQANIHKKEKKVPGETSHGLLPTYLIWYEDQGDVVPLNGKEILTRYKGRHTTRELDSSLDVIMHHCPMLWFLS